MKEGRELKCSQDRYRLVEVVPCVMVFIIASIVTFFGVGNLRKTGLEQKLIKDSALLNRAVDSYRANGGEISEFDTTESVIIALKEAGRRNADGRVPGFSGFYVDERLSWELVRDEDSTEPRVTWNSTSGRFEISYRGRGITAFGLADEAALYTKRYRSNPKEAPFSYATSSGWIWEYEDKAPRKRRVEGPTRVRLLDPLEKREPVTVALPTNVPDSFREELRPPEILVPSGLYITAQLEVFLRNPNPDGSSRILFSIDYGPWSEYVGDPVLLDSDARLIARSVSNDVSEWSDSRSMSADYEIQSPPEQSPKKNVVLDFSDETVRFQGAGSQVFTNIGGSNASLRLKVSGGSGLVGGFESSKVTGDGEIGAFWIAERLDQQSRIFTVDISANPASELDCGVHQLNFVESGSLLFSAKTDKGSRLADPKIVAPRNGSAVTNGTVYRVRFFAPEGEEIVEMTMEWQHGSSQEGFYQGVGLSDIRFAVDHLAEPDQG